MVIVGDLTATNLCKIGSPPRECINKGDPKGDSKGKGKVTKGFDKGFDKENAKGNNKSKNYGKGKGKGYGKDKGKNDGKDDGKEDGKGGKHRQQQWVKGKKMVKGSPDSQSGEPRYHKGGLIPVSPSSRSPATPTQFLSKKGSPRAYERQNPYQRLRTSPGPTTMDSLPGEPEWMGGFENPFQPETEPSGTWYCPSSGFKTADSR
jgi:hypothetical protein